MPFAWVPGGNTRRTVTQGHGQDAPRGVAPPQPHPPYSQPPTTRPSWPHSFGILRTFSQRNPTCAIWGSTLSTQLNSPETCPAGCVSHANTHIYTLTLTLGHAHVLTLTCVHTPPRPRAQAHSCTCSCAHAHTLTSGSGLTPWALYAPWLLATKTSLRQEKPETSSAVCLLVSASACSLREAVLRVLFCCIFAVFSLLRQ